MEWRSLRVRITLSVVLIVAPFLLLSSHIVMATSRRFHSGETKVLARTLLQHGTAALVRPDWEIELATMFSPMSLNGRRIGALVSNDRSMVLWHSLENTPAWPNPKSNTTISSRQNGLTLYINVPDMAFDENRDLEHLFALSGVAVIAFAVTCWLLVGRTLSPIRALARQAVTASAVEVGTKLVAPSQDAEIKDLVATLNDFLTRMEEASAEKGRFYAAASHELRNPLQALAGHLELALSQPRSNVEYEETVQEALVQTQRLTSLMESVLLLHQLQGRLAVSKASFPIGPVIEEVIESLRPLIETRGLEMSLSIETGACVKSVPMHAHVIIRNLIENAVKYTCEAGHIRVNLSSTRFKVENELPDGVLLAADRLFEPFYRQQASRSTKSGGNGLGLAICKAVANTNGWTMELCQVGQFVVADVHFGEWQSTEPNVPGN